MKRGSLFIIFLLAFIAFIFISKGVLATNGFGFDGLSLSALAQNEWINAALLFLLIFAVCSFSLQQVFRRSLGTAFIVSFVLALGGSLGTIYYFGLIIPKLALWVVSLFIIIIISLIWWQFRNRGKIFFIVLFFISIIWLLLGRTQLCYPAGPTPHTICVVLDAAAIGILFISFIKGLTELVKWLWGKGMEGKEIGDMDVNLIIETTYGGTTNPAPGRYIHTKGEIVTIIAIPETTEFKYWIINRKRVLGTTLSLKLKKDVYVKAVFSAREEEREKSRPRKEGKEKHGPRISRAILNISSHGQGKTVPRIGKYEFKRGIKITLKAIPNPNYSFSHWIIDNKAYRKTPYPLIMNTNHKVVAVFTKEKIQRPKQKPKQEQLLKALHYFLTMQCKGQGKTSPRKGRYKFKPNIRLTLKAIPSAGYRFDYWIRNGFRFSTVPAIPIIMDKDYKFIAVFIKKPMMPSSKERKALPQGKNAPVPAKRFNFKEKANLRTEIEKLYRELKTTIRTRRTLLNEIGRKGTSKPRKVSLNRRISELKRRRNELMQKIRTLKAKLRRL